MRHAYLALFLLLATAPAFAQQAGGAYQGYSGGGVPAAQDTAVPQLVPVDKPSAPQAPVVPQVQMAAPAAPVAPDPCAAYAASPSSYAVCKDRMDKIARMKAASTQRDTDLKAYYQRLEQKTAPVTPPAQGQPVAPAQAPVASAPANQAPVAPATATGAAPATAPPSP